MQPCLLTLNSISKIKKVILRWQTMIGVANNAASVHVSRISQIQSGNIYFSYKNYIYLFLKKIISYI